MCETAARHAEKWKQDEVFPAMNVVVEPVERTDLAVFLPNAAVEPEELASYAARHDFAIQALIERTVRILPSRREEALDLLAPIVARSTEEELQRLQPTLRWLARTHALGGGPLAWKRWMANRVPRRTQPRPALDMPIRR